jgi:hypothetical protein
VIYTDCTGSCKSNYYTITTTTVPSIGVMLLHKETYIPNRKSESANRRRRNKTKIRIRQSTKAKQNKNQNPPIDEGETKQKSESANRRRRNKTKIILLFYVQYLIPTSLWPVNVYSDTINLLRGSWLIDIRLVGLLCLTPLSAIVQLYHGDQF